MPVTKIVAGIKPPSTWLISIHLLDHMVKDYAENPPWIGEGLANDCNVNQILN